MPLFVAASAGTLDAMISSNGVTKTRCGHDRVNLKNIEPPSKT